MRCYRIVFLRERVELKPLDKSLVRAELSSVEILFVEGISDLKENSISVPLLLSHKKRGRKINITVSTLHKQISSPYTNGEIKGSLSFTKKDV